MTQPDLRLTPIQRLAFSLAVALLALAAFVQIFGL